jgi:hypothetical protein
MLCTTWSLLKTPEAVEQSVLALAATCGRSEGRFHFEQVTFWRGSGHYTPPFLCGSRNFAKTRHRRDKRGAGVAIGWGNSTGRAAPGRNLAREDSQPWHGARAGISLEAERNWACKLSLQRARLVPGPTFFGELPFAARLRLRGDLKHDSAAEGTAPQRGSAKEVAG